MEWVLQKDIQKRQTRYNCFKPVTVCDKHTVAISGSMRFIGFILLLAKYRVSEEFAATIVYLNTNLCVF